jgi:Uri superfamily endonuclease
MEKNASVICDGNVKVSRIGAGVTVRAGEWRNVGYAEMTRNLKRIRLHIKDKKGERWLVLDVAETLELIAGKVRDVRVVELL